MKKKRQPYNHWVYETVLELSKKYTTKAEFRKDWPSAYSKAFIKGWIHEFEWLKNKGSHTYEEVYEYAKKFKTLKEFRESDINFP